MALILALETTTKVCSVAIGNDAELLILEESRDQEYTHAEKLNVFIEAALQKSNLKFSDISAVAVAGGPGSYTGLRIGVSAAKGLCYSLSKPLIAVDPLLALARGYIHEYKPEEDTLVVPMIDARRDEVFMAVYDHQLAAVAPTSAQIIDSTFFDSYSGKKVVLIGDGAAKFEIMFQGNDQVVVVPDFLASAKHMLPLAADRLAKELTEDVAYFEPFYGKEFQTTVSKKFTGSSK